MKKSAYLFGTLVGCAVVSAFAASPVDYAKKMTMTVNPARAGFETSAVADLPVAVRLSAAIPGFDYADVRSEDADKDLLFTDVSGNPLPYEIETWNPEGESVVWVKLPKFAAGEKIALYYGGETVAQNAAAVWGNYGGVWHMAEASGDVADSSGHKRTAVPGGESAAQNIGTAGVLGGARVNCQTGTAYLQVQNATQLGYGDTFTVSGWFKLDTKNTDGQPTLITTKQRRWDGDGWGLRLQKNSESDLLVRGRGDSGDGTLVIQDVSLKTKWVHVLAAYNGWSVTVYVDGVKQKTYRSDKMPDLVEASWVANPTDSEYPLTFGFNANNVWDDGWSRPFWGSYDEIRISDGTMDATRAKAEYAAQMPDALVYAVSDNSSAGYKPVALTNFSKQFTVSAGYTGEATYADFPMLVRLSEAIEGFKYADFIQKDFSDLAFFDQNGNVLAFDVDTWNVAGESLVWVKVPQFSSSTVLTVAYGGLVQNDVHQPATWGAYRGVWHMNETGSEIADATASAMNGTAHQATAYKADGQLGGSRTMATNRGNSDQNGGVRVPFNPAMNIDTDGKFHLIASSWVKLSNGGNWGGALFSRKNDMADGGWGMAYHMTEMNHYDFYFRESYEGIYTPWQTGAGGYTRYNAEESIWKATSDTESWHKVTFDYSWDGGVVHANVYLDGEKGSECWLFNLKADGEGNRTDERSYAPIYQPTDRGLAFGAYLGSGQHPLLGAMDEIRLRTGEISQDREALEFAQESNAAYHTASAVTAVEGSTVPGHVTLAKPLTVTRRDGDGVITLDVSGNVIALAGASAELKLLLYAAEQKDGDTFTLVETATKTVTAAGVFTFAWDAAKLGTKVHCQVVSDMVVDATHTISVATDEASLLLEDPADFEWKANNKGLWSDAANWTYKATDGLPRVGYPTWGSQFNIYGNQTDEIQVDANYQGLRSGTTLGWGGANITFIGTVDDAEIGYPDNSGFKDGQYANIKVTFDHVKLTVGSYHVWEDAALVLTNGAYLSTRWEFHAEGNRALVDVSTGSELNQIGVDGNRFGFGGEGSTLRINDATVRANTFKIASDSAANKGLPAGIFFSGANPQLLINQYAKIYTDMGGELPIVFTLPVEGYAATPIVKTGTNNRQLFERDSEAMPGVVFSVDRTSPFYTIRKGELEQQIVNWTSHPINTSAITLTTPRCAKGSGWVYGPAEGDKHTLTLLLEKKAGIAILIK